MTRACTGSKLNSLMSRQRDKSNPLTMIDVSTVACISSSLTPRRSPKRIWSRCSSGLIAIYNTSPRPNKPENTTPITVSGFRRVRSLMYALALVQRSAASSAPSDSGRPTAHARTIPGKTAWLIASPISDQPLSTSTVESNAVGTASKSATTSAFSIKANCQGASKASIMSGNPRQGTAGLG